MQPRYDYDVRFGTEDVDAEDWRAANLPDEADDDEELAVTPQSVIAVLGYDPLDND